MTPDENDENLPRVYISVKIYVSSRSTLQWLGSGPTEQLLQLPELCRCV